MEDPEQCVGEGKVPQPRRAPDRAQRDASGEDSENSSSSSSSFSESESEDESSAGAALAGNEDPSGSDGDAHNLVGLQVLTCE